MAWILGWRKIAIKILLIFIVHMHINIIWGGRARGRASEREVRKHVRVQMGKIIDN